MIVSGTLKWLVALVVVANCAFGQEPSWRNAKPEPFHGRPVKVEGGRWDPDPVWVNIAWEDQVDRIFYKLRQEVVGAVSAPSNSDKAGVWAKKAKQAFDAWHQNHQNPELLYRAAAYLGATTIVDTAFAQARSSQRMFEEVNQGFSCLRSENVPPSYEFCRRAYLTNAGDTDLHRFRDLSFRLLKRDPVDRGVLIAMTREYAQLGGPNPKFEKIMFDGLFACAKTKAWRYWDDQWIANALVMVGVFHKQKSYYDKALTYLDRAIAKTPKGIDPAPMVKLRAAYLKERDLPNFGRPTFNSKGIR